MQDRRTWLASLTATTLLLLAGAPAARGADSGPALPAAALAAAAPTSPTATADPYAEYVGKRFSHGLRTRKRVALTFDDGPHPKNTPQVIRILKDAGVKATFFELGEMVEKYPAVTKMVAEAGFEIGDHSVSHANLVTLDADKVWSEMDETRKRIEDVTGLSPRLFRPPYGNINATVTRAAVKAKMVLCLWAVDTNDWKADSTPAGIVNTVRTETKNGDIILMHDIHAKTLEALPGVIKALMEEGFEMVTVGDLLRDEAEAPPEEKNAPAPAASKTSGEKTAPIKTAPPAPPLVMSLDEAAKY